ncbi:MAG TPA: hypothetical protein VHY08_01855 [Bacillota bacterium]|nr:hypothetical protein [Bacillota bacterium]
MRRSRPDICPFSNPPTVTKTVEITDPPSPENQNPDSLYFKLTLKYSDADIKWCEKPKITFQTNIPSSTNPNGRDLRHGTETDENEPTLSIPASDVRYGLAAIPAPTVPLGDKPAKLSYYTRVWGGHLTFTGAILDKSGSTKYLPLKDYIFFEWDGTRPGKGRTSDDEPDLKPGEGAVESQAAGRKEVENANDFEPGRIIGAIDIFPPVQDSKSLKLIIRADYPAGRKPSFSYSFNGADYKTLEGKVTLNTAEIQPEKDKQYGLKEAASITLHPQPDIQGDMYDGFITFSGTLIEQTDKRRFYEFTDLIIHQWKLKDIY